MKKSIILLFICIFTFILTGCGKKNPVAGKYACTYLTGQQHADFNIELNKDKTFKYGIYSQKLEGKYTYEYEGESKDKDKVKSYAVTLTFELGIKSDDTVTEETKFKILKSDDNIIFTFLDEDPYEETMFLCKKK